MPRKDNRDILTTPPDGRPMEDQPRWRRDFPIDWPQDDYVARRDFTKFLVLTSLAFTVGQFWILGQNYLRKFSGRLPIRQIGSLSSIPVGGTLTFKYPFEHDDCLLVRTGPRSVVAYSQKCTHLSCPVKPDPHGASALVCPCHNGRFDLATGQPVAGPPRRPLSLVNLDIRGDSIFATGITERS